MSSRNSDIRNFFGLKPVPKIQSQDKESTTASVSQKFKHEPGKMKKEEAEKKRKSDQYHFRFCYK
jgi:hypothetical protein